MHTFLLFALLFSTQIFCDEAQSDSKVVILTDKNFDELVTPESGGWLIEFYAPWCGHCKNLAPTWEELAKQDISFKVAKVDCTVEKTVASRFEIRGYPTIKFFKDGKTYDYKGPRTVTEFTNFATGGFANAAGGQPPKPAEKKVEEKKVEEKKADEPSDVVVLTEANFETQTKEGSWLVEFYAPWCGHCKKLAPIWEQLATASKGKFNVAKVDATIDKDLATKHGIRGFPTIQLFKNGEFVETFKGQRTVEEFTSFVEKFSPNN